MRKRISLVQKLIVLVILLTIIYNEYIIYEVTSWSWANVKCRNETDCVKILLVADPQLIGEENENIHFITPISIWDSDRYIKKTYTKVLNSFTPDVIIFLGDLFDEGSIANAAQYNRYVKRLFSIFATDIIDVKHIWLPGDNDVGGEDEEITDSKVKRFDDVFVQPKVIHIKHLIFSKINRMLLHPLKPFEVTDNNEFQISIALSHMPLIKVPELFIDKVIEIVKPRFIFAAHDHRSRIIETDNKQSYHKLSNIYDNEIHEFQLDKDKIYEFIVPTCSYRMGTNHIGYSIATIENDGSLQYTVMWSPSRFSYLTIYFFVLVIILICLVKYYIFSRILGKNKISIRRYV